MIVRLTITTATGERVVLEQRAPSTAAALRAALSCLPALPRRAVAVRVPALETHG